MSDSNSINYFNLISKKYKANEYASLFITNYLRRHIVNKIAVFENKAILDIMSGRGENIHYIKQYNENTTFTTIDYSNEMNAIAKKRLKNKSIKQIEHNFLEVDCPNKSFDVIFCSFGIKTLGLNNINRFSKKLNSILKPEGEIVLLEMVKPKNKHVTKVLKFYTEKVITKIFGSRFIPLFSFIHNHENMNSLKKQLINNNLLIIEHKRVLDLFEIIHAKKATS